MPPKIREWADFATSYSRLPRSTWCERSISLDMGLRLTLRSLFVNPIWLRNGSVGSPVRGFLASS